MNQSITYVSFEKSDFEPFVRISQKLWKDFNEEELQKLLKQVAESGKNNILLAKTESKVIVGFAIFSIRTDYVEGAEQSPTGYLEGIYVEPEFRQKGIAKSFIHKGEKWCKDRDCTQIGSDTWLTDKASRNFHKKMGFWEEEEIVHFLKNLN